MEKTTGHRIGELMIATGFLTVVVGGLGSAVTGLGLSPLYFGIGGFLIFLIGVEIYLRTRETPY